MQIVELKVQVEKSQLAALESQVKALDGKSINIKVNTAGLTALDKATLKSLDSLTKYQNAQNRGAQISSKTAQAEAKVAVSKEKTAQAEARLMTQTERTRTERARASTQAQRTITEQAKLQTQIEKTRTAQERAAKSAQAYGKTTQEASRLNRMLGGSVGEVAAKMAAWQVMGAMVSVPIHAMKEALATMKKVDTQLVDIRKVTDFNKQQMAEIEEQSYKTASAYGLAADQYLASVAAFARAGYKEQSNDLAELSVKTQLVGNTTADVANQFLLSTDAAYNYHGSIQELSKVLDGANEIDNNYATSIEKIAEGMGIVAPVAAQAHVGVDELMASLGTITAVTQRSGSEAARALRALFLNIIGDTKTEIDEGVTWTTGEIAGLQDVLRKFAPDVVATADAMGTVINPMEAMHALSQAMKDDVLNEQELMEMVSDIGGKLRTSQLLAIIENWDMYESMLSDFKSATGSADKEVENAMDSWERKSEILKNTWTKFVSDMVNTDAIKGGLDGITNVIEVLDSGLGQTAIKAAAFAAATAGIAKAVTGIGAALKGSTLLSTFLGLQGPGMTLFGRLAGGISALAASFGPLALVLGAIAAVVAAPALVDFFTTDYKEHGENISQLKSEYEELYGAQSEFEELRKKSVSDEGLSEYEQKRLDYLENYRNKLEQNIKAEKEAAKAKYQEQYGSMAQDSLDENYRRNGGKGRIRSETIDVKMLREAKKAYEELSASLNDGTISEGEFKTGLQDIMDTYADFVSATREGLENGWIDYGDLTEAQKGILDLYDALERLFSFDGKELRIENALADFEQSGQGMTDFANQTVINAERMREALRDAGVSAEDANKTIQELRDGGAIVIDVENDGIDETLSNLEELGVAVRDGENWKINVDGLTDLLTDLGLSRDKANELAKALSEVDGVGLVDAEGNAVSLLDTMTKLGMLPPLELLATDGVTPVANEAQSSVESVDESHNTDFLGDPSGVSGASSTAKNDIRTVPPSHTTVFNGDTGPIAAAVARAKSLIASIGGAITSGKGTGGGGWGSGSAGLHKATGDLHFRGGPVLLGDELSSDGSPRPELVITKSGAFIAGMGGPVMTSLPVGSRIYKYSDTMDILSGGDMEQLQAFKGGTGLGGLSLSQLRARGKAAATNTSSSNSSSGSSGSKPSSANRSSNSSRSSGSRSSGSSGRSSNGSGRSSGTSNGNVSNIDALKDELELLEAQYQFLEASGASADDLIAKSQEIQSHLHTINERLRTTGGAEKDIVGYSTEWWKELDKIWEVQKKIFEDARNLYQSELDLMRANSTDDEERIEKLYAVLENLHEEAEFLRSIDADQEEINQLSVEWWKTQEDIYSVMEDQRSLMESQVTLMEHQKAPAQERIAIMRREQENLHQQAEYMRSIGARQEDINRLSIQWWEIQEKILDTQQKLVDELNAAVNLELRRAMRARDLAIKRIDEEIKKEQEKRDLKKEQVDLSERELEVKKAQIALDNALRERTVRYYNAATGQWERGADANAVRSAREALEEARKSKKEYDEENEYNLRIKELESQKDQINQNYQDLENRWDLLLESFEDPLRDIKEILADLLATGKLTDEQVALVKSLVGDISSYTSQILQFLPYLKYTQANPGATIQEYLEAFTGGAVDTSGFSQSFLDWLQKNPDAEWVYTDGNGNAFYSNGTASTESPFNTPGGVNFLHPSDAVSSVTEYNSSTSSTSGMPGSAVSAFVSALENTAKGETRTTVTGGGSSGDGNYRPIKTGSQKSKSGLYDSGGVLSGVGGIKATAEDEIVIPPDVARAMLAPSADNTFRRRMSELGYLYGASSKPPASIIGNTNSRTSSDHYGDLYQFGNVIMTEGQARSTSVYDLARMSRSLGIYKNG